MQLLLELVDQQVLFLQVLLVEMVVLQVFQVLIFK
tara:strand:+ start:1092 stop:1196 length:105 start_codon:yes stop_codon:yes gene_type:complete